MKAVTELAGWIILLRLEVCQKEIMIQIENMYSHVH